MTSLTFEADVVGVSLHGEGGGVLLEARGVSLQCLRLGQTLVLQAHARLALHVVVQMTYGRQQLRQHVVLHRHLWAGHIVQTIATYTTFMQLLVHGNAAAHNTSRNTHN